jgi:hypothetical protein
MCRVRFLICAFAACVISAASSAASPISVDPGNPHYFSMNGVPTILLTSAEHYGAVVNGDFDYVPYLDALASYGLNYTRIYPGALIEPVDKWIKGNTLGPKPGSLVLPWARSLEPGYALGGARFDLDQWDSAFFRRLSDFIARAAERGIVVEICFFNAQYEDTWPLSPWYDTNNIQGIGRCPFNDVQTLSHPDLVDREVDYVRRIVQEVNSFDNVILEICDEPIINGTPITDAGSWIRHILEAILQTEQALPKRHLVTQQVEGYLGGPCDLSGDPDISIVTTQYVVTAMGDQEGGLKALTFEYGHDKPIELNETAYYPVWYGGDAVADSRVEAWEFIIGGGAGYNHLNGRFTAAKPSGATPDNTRVLTALKNLKRFMEELDFSHMRADLSYLANWMPPGVFCRGMSEPGNRYVLYLHHSRHNGDGSSYIVTPGTYTVALELDIPAGTYNVEWVDPASGSLVRSERVPHQGGIMKLMTPVHSIDIALRIVRVL